MRGWGTDTKTNLVMPLFIEAACIILQGESMNTKRLLFVTYHDDTSNEGISYALDLAKTMNDSVEVVLIYKRKVLERFEDMMTVVTYAEANDHKTARELISEDYRRQNGDYEKHVALLKEMGLRKGVNVEVSTAAMDTLSAVRNLLRQNSRIDMVLVGPTIAEEGSLNVKALKKLVQRASRPVVMMTRQTNAA
jgi:hypothetical protein